MSKKLLAKKLIKSLSSTKGVKQSTLDNPFFGSFYKNVPSPTPLSKKIITSYEYSQLIHVLSFC